jgi:hypothetical protein
MEFSVQDKSKYLKGLLIIAKKDNQLAETEKNIIRKIAERLGFAEDFYEDTLKSLLSNKYIHDDPIIFADQKIAKFFVKDGLKLAFSDNKVSEVEINWLYNSALLNGIEEKWFDEKLAICKNQSSPTIGTDFALFSII